MPSHEPVSRRGFLSLAVAVAAMATPVAGLMRKAKEAAPAIASTTTARSGMTEIKITCAGGDYPARQMIYFADERGNIMPEPWHATAIDTETGRTISF